MTERQSKLCVFLIFIAFIGCTTVYVIKLVTSRDRSLEMILHTFELKDKIDYSKPYEEIKPEIDRVLESFDECIAKYPHIWKRGYNQKCQYLKRLYHFYYKIDEDVFIQEYQKIFDMYLLKNKIDDDIHPCFQYAMFKKFQGKDVECLKILELIYKPDMKYTFVYDGSSLADGYLASEDVINYIAGRLLGRINKYRLSNTFYEEIFEFGGGSNIFNHM